jgi:hypothetical protein
MGKCDCGDPKKENLNTMNKKRLLSIIILNLGILTLNAQITIRENEVVEKAIYKPQQFDSLTNIAMQKNPLDYKKYIGYKLFFLPKSKKYKPQYISNYDDKFINYLFTEDTVQIIKNGKIPFQETTLSKILDSKNLTGASLNQYNEMKVKYEIIDKEKTNVYLPHFYYERTDNFDGKIYGKIGTLPDSVEGKYFTIIDIKGKEPYRDNEYKKLEQIDIENDRNWQLSMKISLRDESNKDTLYWIIQQARFISAPFFLVPYFEKQKKMYLNQNIVLKYKDGTISKLENLIDVNTGATVSIKYGEVWTCSDISFVDTKDFYYLTGFYFLKNGDREVKIDIGSELISNYFMLEADFKKQELEKQKKEEERIREEQEREKKEREEKIKYRNECLAKWGQKMGSYIADNKVVLGMNKEMCTVAWGNPIEINRTIVRGLTSEQWVYGWGTYLYFDNGTLSAIQD